METPTQRTGALAAADADLALESSGDGPVEDDAADTDLPFPGADDADLALESSGDEPVEDNAADTDLPLPGA